MDSTKNRLTERVIRCIAEMACPCKTMVSVRTMSGG